MISVSDLVKSFHTGDSCVTAANHLNLQISDGEFVSIVGRSGSGKSTLLHLIGGLDVPDSGEICVNGQMLTAMNAKQLAKYRAHTVGFIFQAFHLEPFYSVYENICVALMIAGVPSSQYRKRVLGVLEQVGMTDKLRVPAAKLSGGEKQRVAIARALINDPPLILADEPCGNLDSVNAARVMELLIEMNRRQKTVVLVTHNLSDAKKAGRVIELCDGVIITDETIQSS